MNQQGDSSDEIDEEQFRQDFEQKVEQRKQWLMAELQGCGKYLDVSAKQLDDLDALTIALYLHECRYDLQIFHIGSNKITDRGFLDMLSGLQWHENIREIYIGNNLITDIGVQGIVEISPLFKQLKILSMSGCSIDDDTFIKLCYQLPDLKQLQQLSIPVNDIGDYGLICFSSLLATNSMPNLSILHFGGNPLTTKSLIPFFNALRKNTTVKILYLNDIGIPIAAIKSITDCLLKNKTLEELNLGNTGFSDQAATLMWPALKHLKTLHLWNNHLTDKSLLHLVEVLDNNSIALTYLGISDNNIVDEELIDDVRALLKQNELIEQMVESPEMDDLDELKQQIDLAQVEEIEEKLNELEKLGSPPQEEPEVNELQGQLKTQKWTKETEEDGIRHSNFE